MRLLPLVRRSRRGSFRPSSSHSWIGVLKATFAGTGPSSMIEWRGTFVAHYGLPSSGRRCLEADVALSNADYPNRDRQTLKLRFSAALAELQSIAS